MHRRGHLYWARLDKRRPVLVVSVDARNERASDLIVIPCSTTLRDGPTHVRLRAGEGGVRNACVLKCEQITTLPKDDVEGVSLGSSLAVSRIVQVEIAVLRAIGVAV